MEYGPLIVMTNIFWKYFARFEGLDHKFKPFFIYQSTTINQKLNMMKLSFFILLHAI